MKLWKRPFRPEDLQRLDLQHVQSGELERAGDARILAEVGEAWTVIAGEPSQPAEQRVRGCGGLIYFTPARAKAWTLLGRGLARREWGFIVTKMRMRLDELQANGLRRVEAETRLDFAGGHNLLFHIGFRFEGVNYGAGHDGEPLAQFARLLGIERRQDLVRYDSVRGLAYRMVIEDVLERRHHRRAA